jgi:predicted dehydrogenase
MTVVRAEPESREVEISRLRIGVVGAGGMGANHARVIAESDVADLAIVVDRDESRARALAERFGVRAARDLSDLVARCDAAFVATTTPSHVEIALALLDRGLPVFVEKPLAETAADAERLLDASRDADLPLMCGFVERFNPGLITAISLLDAPVVHLRATRHSPRNPAAAASIVQDLLIHDIDLALRVSAGYELPDVSGASWTPPGSDRSEVAEGVLQFSDGMVANLSASRWGQRKVRDVSIVTDRQLIEIDLLRVNVTVYRNISQAVVEGGGPYRAETVVDVPFVRHRGEPLALQLAAFVELVRSGDVDRAEAERRSILPPHLVAAAMEKV